MSSKQNRQLILVAFALLFAVTLSCDRTAEEEPPSPVTPPPGPDGGTIVSATGDATQVDVLVPKPIQIGPKTAGGTLQFKDGVKTINPTGGDAIRSDLTVKATVSGNSAPLPPSGEIRFLFKDVVSGSSRTYSEVTVELRSDGSLHWQRNGVDLKTCDPCTPPCATEMFPREMLNEMLAPILVRQSPTSRWIALEQIKIYREPVCP